MLRLTFSKSENAKFSGGKEGVSSNHSMNERGRALYKPCNAAMTAMTAW